MDRTAWNYGDMISNRAWPKCYIRIHALLAAAWGYSDLIISPYSTNEVGLQYKYSILQMHWYTGYIYLANREGYI